MQMNELNQEEQALIKAHRAEKEAQAKRGRFSMEINDMLIQWLSLDRKEMYAPSWSEFINMLNDDTLTLSDEFQIRPYNSVAQSLLMEVHELLIKADRSILVDY